MSSLARRTAAMIDAAITSVDVKSTSQVRETDRRGKPSRVDALLHSRLLKIGGSTS